MQKYVPKAATMHQADSDSPLSERPAGFMQVPLAVSVSPAGPCCAGLAGWYAGPPCAPAWRLSAALFASSLLLVLPSWRQVSRLAVFPRQAGQLAATAIVGTGGADFALKIAAGSCPRPYNDD